MVFALGTTLAFTLQVWIHCCTAVCVRHDLILNVLLWQQGGNGNAVPGKPLTMKEQLAAEEAKDKLERMVKVCESNRYRYLPLSYAVCT